MRLKNKGSQRHKRGPKRPKYQAPYPEHPDTAQPLSATEIHANHLEAFHTSLRGYPATFSHCYSEIKQPSCGNETQGDCKDRACFAYDGCY